MAEYDVGYRKPPKSGQFKPGESGNRSGRPKQPLSISAQLRRELNRRVTIVENGVKKKITLQEATLRQLVTKAAKGDTKSTQIVLALRAAIDLPSIVPTESLHDSDSAVLANFLKRLSDTEGGDE